MILVFKENMILYEGNYAMISYLEERIAEEYFAPIAPSDLEFKEYLSEADVFYGKDYNVPICVIIDISNAKFLDSQKRIQIGRLIKKHEQNLIKNFLGIAYVNTSIISAVILKGIFVVNPLPVPHKVFTKKDEALTWCRTLIQHG